ncbi:37115_t:CDS:2, partial [Racocetra persica]
ENLKDIQNSLEEQLEILSNHKSLRLGAINKAIKLLENLPRTLKRKDILNFLENQDLKFAESRYKVNVELSVVTDKTVMTGKTTEKFARSLNNDHDIRGSESQDSSTKTQTTVNNEQEENKQEESKPEENKLEENEGGDVLTGESSTMCVKDILEDSIEVSPVIKEASIMDLRPKSKFSLLLDLGLQKTILHEVFDEIDNYITDDIHEYLTSFFNKDFTAQGWDNAINNIDFDKCDSEHLKNIKKLIQETLPKFLKAFSLEDLNPLRDITILEKPHLNQFVHPIIDSALWNFAKVDHFCLPKNWVDMPNFVWLYEAIIKWALCVNSTRNGLIEHRKKRRVSRYSEVGIAKKLAPLRDQHE